VNRHEPASRLLAGPSASPCSSSRHKGNHSGGWYGLWGTSRCSRQRRGRASLSSGRPVPPRRVRRGGSRADQENRISGLVVVTSLKNSGSKLSPRQIPGPPSSFPRFVQRSKPRTNSSKETQMDGSLRGAGGYFCEASIEAKETKTPGKTKKGSRGRSASPCPTSDGLGPSPCKSRPPCLSLSQTLGQFGQPC